MCCSTDALAVTGVACYDDHLGETGDDPMATGELRAAAPKRTCCYLSWKAMSYGLSLRGTSE